jgi:hypothetical protein
MIYGMKKKKIPQKFDYYNKIKGRKYQIIGEIIISIKQMYIGINFINVIIIIFIKIDIIYM